MGYEKQIKIETFAKYLLLRPVPGSVPIFRYEKWERILAVMLAMLILTLLQSLK